ncbi:MAG: hypothetical protein JRJ29_00460 [Deltaproteobacteria bacterium]|nr:hypothetical protein [Deltaproteobacteria bacterium]
MGEMKGELNFDIGGIKEDAEELAKKAKKEIKNEVDDAKKHIKQTYDVVDDLVHGRFDEVREGHWKKGTMWLLAAAGLVLMFILIGRSFF